MFKNLFKNPATLEMIINFISFLGVILFIMVGRKKKKSRISEQEKMVLAEVKESSQQSSRPYEIEYWQGRKGGSGNRQDYTAIWGSFSFVLSLHLVVSPETPVAKIFKFIGIHDEEIGIENFDRKFFIKSNQPAILPLIFHQETQEAFQKIPGFHSFSTVSPQQIMGNRGRKKKDFVDPGNPFQSEDLNKRNSWLLQLKGRIQDPDSLKIAIEQGLFIAQQLEKYAPPALQGQERVKRWDQFRYPSFQALTSFFLIVSAVIGIALLWNFGLLQ